MALLPPLDTSLLVQDPRSVISLDNLSIQDSWSTGSNGFFRLRSNIPSLIRIPPGGLFRWKRIPLQYYRNRIQDPKIPPQKNENIGSKFLQDFGSMIPRIHGPAGGPWQRYWKAYVYLQKHVRPTRNFHRMVVHSMKVAYSRIWLSSG